MKQKIVLSDGEGFRINGKHYMFENEEVYKITRCFRCKKLANCECKPMSIDELKAVIVNDYKKKTFYPSDVADRYKSDYYDVLEACNILKKEGKLK